jgi:AAA15 family ATPase/GTPase
MYPSTFEISNFRSFSNLIVPLPSQITLLTGMNNAGKTAALEALYFWIQRDNPGVIFELLQNRGYNPIRDIIPDLPCSSFFSAWNTQTPITIKAYDEQKNFEVLTVRLEESEETLIDSRQPDTINPNNVSSERLNPMKLLFEVFKKDNNGEETSITFLWFNSRGVRVPKVSTNHSTREFFINTGTHRKKDENAALFSALDITGQATDLVRDLKIIEPYLKRLSVITNGRESSIFGDVGLGHMLSLQDMGEGLNRLMSLLLRIASAQGGFVLIDEIESGFHYSKLEDVWRLVQYAAQHYQVRIVATTHSYECIQAAVTTFSEANSVDFSLLRLERNKNETISIPIDLANARYLVKNNLEIR